MALPAAPTASDAELAAAIDRGIVTGDLIALTPDLLAAMAPAPAGYGSDRHDPDTCGVCATIPAYLVARHNH